jgi:raffinose/stachyose/melibiose transport system permease protein
VKHRGSRKRSTAGALFVLPAVGVFALFLLFPILALFAISMMHWTGFDLGQASWAGVANYRAMAHDAVFTKALIHTALFVVITTLALNVIGLPLALLINARVRGNDFLRVAMFIPLGVSPVIAGVLWQRILGPFGLINNSLESLHLIHQPINFLGDPNLAFATVLVASIWQFSGYDMLLYYAGLQSLPPELLEAAAIDGAGFFRSVRYITIPFLKPVMAIIVVLNLIGGWKIFDIVYVVTGGGPNRSTEVLSTYLYQQAFSFTQVGYAAAIGVIIVILAVASAMTRRIPALT